MDRDALNGTVAHAAVIPHDILDLLDGDILELGILNELADVPGRVDEMVLLNEIKQSTLNSSPLNLLLFRLLIKLIKGSLVLLDFGDDVRNVRL